VGVGQRAHRRRRLGRLAGLVVDDAAGLGVDRDGLVLRRTGRAFALVQGVRPGGQAADDGDRGEGRGRDDRDPAAAYRAAAAPDDVVDGVPGRPVGVVRGGCQQVFEFGHDAALSPSSSRSWIRPREVWLLTVPVEMPST
jgi:hypothetical protein